MLIIHPSSRCDVCLDAYTFQSPDQTPHAIPCGHIFCKTCLANVTPTNCPLCRKGFTPDRAKKLHVDRLDASQEDVGPDIVLLRRLLMAWDSPEDQLVDLTDEIGVWLDTQHEEESLALRKAREALAKYHRLRVRVEHDRLKVRFLEGQLRERDKRMAGEKDTTKAVEASLLAEVSNLQTKVSEYETEIAALRIEVQRPRYRKNPLPPPPEPIPLDQLPSLFADAAAATSSGSTHVGWPTTTNNDEYSFASSRKTPSLFRQHNYGVENATRAEVRDNLDEPHRRRDRKGKGRERTPYSIYRNPTPTELSADARKMLIIPGATPNQRVFPNVTPKQSNGDVTPSIAAGVYNRSNADNSAPLRTNGHASTSRQVDPARDYVDPFTLTAAYVSEYASGYGEGYQVAMNDPPQTSAPHTVTTRAEAHVDTSNSIHSPLLEHGQPSQYTHWPTGSAEGSVLQWITSEDASAERPRIPHTVSAGAVLGGSIESPNSSAHSIRSRANRRSTMQSDISIPRTPTSLDVRAPGPRRHLSLASEGSLRSRNSASSWGTVLTHGGQQSLDGSLSLGLRDFPHALAASSRTSLSSSSSMDPFPPDEDDEDDNDDNDERSNRRNHNRTPNNGGYPGEYISDLLGVRPVRNNNTSREDRHARSRRSHPITNGPTAQAEGMHYPEPIMPESHTEEVSTSAGLRSGRSGNRHRPNRGPWTASERSNYTPISAPAVAEPWLNGSYLTDAPVSAHGDFGNALGLALNEPAAAPTITAPTPRTSTRAFLRSFSSDYIS